MEATVDAIVAPLVHRRGAADHRRRRRACDGERGRAAAGPSNEASVEKAARERMLEVVVEVDGRPLSRWGCDGVVCATPTGSTAYAFSAGGPVVWPEVEALLLVPLSAHALFARPLVVAPTSRARRRGAAPAPTAAGVLWCDGRRTVDLPPGARIEVRRRSDRRCGWPGCTRRRSPTGWSPSSTCPVEGWRGAAERRRERRDGGVTPMLEELRIRRSGVIDEAVLELGPGPERRHRRDRCRQDDGGHRARAAARRRGPTPAAVRKAPRAARVEGGRSRVGAGAGLAGGADEAGGASSTTGCSCWRGTVSAEGRSRATAGGARAGCGAVLGLTDASWSPCTGSPTSSGCCGRPAQRDCLDALRWAPPAAGAGGLPRRRTDGCEQVRARAAPRSSRSARERAQEADLLRFGLAEIAAAEPSRARTSRSRRGGAARRTPTRCAPRPSRPRRRSPATSPARRAGRARRWSLPPARPSTTQRDQRPEAGRAGRPAGECVLRCSPTWPPTSRRTPRRLDTDPARLAAVSERRAALDGAHPQVRRHARGGAGWAEQAAGTGCWSSTDDDDRIERAARRRRQTCSAGWPDRAARSSAGARGGGRAARRRSPPSWPALAMAHAGCLEVSDVGDAGRRRRPHGARTTPAFDDVELLLAASRARSRVRWQGRVRRRAVPRHAGARGRLAGSAPRCRRWSSTRSTPGSAARRRSRSVAGWPGWPRSSQVIVVTHLPQVAAFADRHHVVVRRRRRLGHHERGHALDDAGRRPRAVPDAGRAGGLRDRARPRRASCSSWPGRPRSLTGTRG